MEQKSRGRFSNPRTRPNPPRSRRQFQPSKQQYVPVKKNPVCQMDGPPKTDSIGNDNGHSHIDGLRHEDGLQREASNCKDTVHNSNGDMVDVCASNDDRCSDVGEPSHVQSLPDKVVVDSGSECLDSSSGVAVFDICQIPQRPIPKLNASLLETNKAIRKEIKCSKNGHLPQLLRPGMILIKNFIGPRDQIAIVKKCRELGIGTGGFYQPGYRDGAKLHLQMMCLGKNWDPETRLYGDRRSIDNARPPGIPPEFKRFVEESVRDSQAFIGKNSNSFENIPSMKPDVCIVNFYTRSGKLGLHQDKDESKESLSKGLPVVSFSFGDSAEFLYGNGRDVDKAEMVVLESGDVLIFGGKSRHVYHGVQSILPGTAPKFLTDETYLRPGRLNLTFREY